jgi:orotidine-5'-phosphate decarboxylase
MGAFVSRAHQAGSCLLVVTRSSNPEGRAVQSALDGNGRQVDERLLGEIGKLNLMLAPGQIGPVGAVVGPARIEPELDLAGAQALFLAPGVGAQGAAPEDVARVFAACPARVMPSASRSLLAAGPGIKAMQDRAAAMAAEFSRLLPARTDARRETLLRGFETAAQRG